MADHLTDLTSAESHTVKPWLSSRLDFAPPVEDFAGEGFALVGGRFDYLDGKPVAALVYRFRQHIIHVLSGLRQKTRRFPFKAEPSVVTTWYASIPKE